MPGWLRVSSDDLRTHQLARWVKIGQPSPVRPRARDPLLQDRHLVPRDQGLRVHGGQAANAGTPVPGPNHDLSELQPPRQGQAVRNGLCALSDYKFYLFFTLTVHFDGALIVYLARHP
jgi:hypothetical protein